MTKNIKLLFILIILLSAGILRFSLLFTPHRYPTGDEALVGMMAKQLIENGKITIRASKCSVFRWCLYIEAYIIAVSFKIFGVSDVSLKIPIILLSLISLFLVMSLGFKFLGISKGITLGIVYGFCPAFARWNILAWCGYIETLIFIPFLIIIFLKIFEKNKLRDIIFLGFVSAVAFWNQPIILSFIIMLALLIFVGVKSGFVKATLYILISVLPRIIIELNNKSSVFIQQYIPSVDFKNFFSRLLKVFYFDLPAFFNTDNVDNFPDKVSSISYLWYALT